MTRKIPYLFKKRTPEDLVSAAVSTARWLQKYGVEEPFGKSWKVFPDGQQGLSGNPFVGKQSFYAGVSGIGFFYLRLYQATGEEEWLQEAKAAAEYLLHHETPLSWYREIQQDIADKKPGVNGWYFSYKAGPIGDAQFLNTLYHETKDLRYRESAIRTTDTFVQAAIEEKDGIRWSQNRDIVGDAGGLVFLLQMYRDTGKKEYLETAEKGAAWIVRYGHPAKNGGTWYDLYDLSEVGEGAPGTVHVNFSHGSAGTGYLFACLYEVTGKNKYLRLAEDVVAYLSGISVGDADAVLLPYQDHPEGEPLNRYYLGMCGGPPGTTLLFRKLYQATGDEKYAGWIQRLAEGLVESGVPEHNSWGYWGSKCICCGGPGVLEYFSSLADFLKDPAYLRLAERTADVLLGDAFEEENGLTWYGAWDRTVPDRVVSYTGFYIGAAGAAGSLLRLYAAEKQQHIANFFEYLL